MQLDDAYAIAAHVDPDATYPPRWASEAEEFRLSLGDRAELSIAYGDRPREVLDLFLPPADPVGTVIFVHGGYWRAFDQTYWSHFARGALARGWAVAMPSYDLCPDVRIHQITRQIAKAVQQVARRTAGPIALTGHSAGGHLVSRMLDPDLLPETVAERLRTVVPIAPLADLRPLINTSMNDDLKLDATEAVAESPVFMQRRHKSAVIVWVGEIERPALIDQARWLSDAWKVELVIAPGRHHFDVIDLLKSPESDLVCRLTA